ncbi:MAG: hypothetical protein HOP91_10120 [Sphingomonas sp.]|nr:hypothetical protein [Sphingomonas sp.]
MSEPEEHRPTPDPSPKGEGKRPPRWTIPFLRALERTGDVRASAEDAGIDHTTAYLRRRTHPEFASDWERALKAHAERVERDKAEELEALRKAAPPRSGELSCPSPEGEGKSKKAQLKRTGHDRWSARKEKLFFDELAATANVKSSAKAAGVSPNAVYARRLRDPHFRAKWAAVLETGRAAIEMQLVERAKKSFDPDEMDLGDAEPRVSVAEALRIVQPSGAKGYTPAFVERRGFDEQDDDEVREQLIQKLLRLKRRREEQQLREGWSRDEESGLLIPPGWVRSAGSPPVEP